MWLLKGSSKTLISVKQYIIIVRKHLLVEQNVSLQYWYDSHEQVFCRDASLSITSEYIHCSQCILSWSYLWVQRRFPIFLKKIYFTGVTWHHLSRRKWLLYFSQERCYHMILHNISPQRYWSTLRLGEFDSLVECWSAICDISIEWLLLSAPE